MHRLRSAALLLTVLLTAGPAFAATAPACVSDAAAWSALAVAFLQSRSSSPYEKLEAEAMGALPALNDAAMTLQSSWPAGRTALLVSGRDCASGEVRKQLVWFRTRAYREAWVYGRNGKADSALAETAPLRALVDLAPLHLPEAELLPAPAAEFLARNVSAGAPVRRSDLKSAPLVKRNADVVVVVQGRGLVVRTRGTALQYGAEGDWVPVMVVGAEKSTRARVVAPGVVHVDI